MFERACIITTLVFILTASPVKANINVTVRGNIIAAPSCVINNNNTIDVDFGNNIYTSKVDGQNYRKNLVYTLVCDSSLSNNLKLAMQGTAAGFDGALATNKSNLGIKFYANNTALDVNSWLNFTYDANNLPALEAVPVKRSGATLTTGAFDTNATLVVEVQ
ncbi:fimbrial protein [Pantoea endophytica]|uniref:Fimbrial protein n=1 Tax=Pantoea sp. BJ2 TaxID=3141322 RepID=A0AAU7TWI8_9GAMM